MIQNPYDSTSILIVLENEVPVKDLMTNNSHTLLSKKITDNRQFAWSSFYHYAIVDHAV